MSETCGCAGHQCGSHCYLGCLCCYAVADALLDFHVLGEAALLDNPPEWRGIVSGT